ncbi:MAG: hypothetical protein PHV20_00195 [Bacteroidales bacterium]|nr:hypothetical protein [Bacteroidales bacterium]
MNHIKLGLTIEKTFFILVLIFLSSCIYEPFGIYENPINSNSTTAEITNLELSVNADTLWVYGDQTLKYHFKSSNEKQNTLGLKIYIDGVIRDSISSSNGEFHFQQSAFSEGKHLMKILLYVKSATGSVADRLNAEAILLTKEWVVMADYSKRNITYSIENGYLKLHWDIYKNLDLKFYRVQYSGTTQNNYYVDSLYYGAQRTFTITVEKTNGDIITWGTLNMAQNIAQPELKITNDNRYYISWHKSPYYSTIKYRYEFHNSDDNSPSYGDYGFKNANDTVYISNLHFSDYFNFSLYTVPKKTNEITNDYMIYPSGYMLKYAGQSVDIKSNTSYTSADTLTSFDAKNVYKYLLSGETVYSESILPVSSSEFNALQLSPRGKFLLGVSYASNSTGMRYFAKDLSTNRVYYMDYIEPGAYELNYNLSMHISDNGIGIFESATQEFLFDFKNNTKIASRTLSSPQSDLFLFKISPDGKHVISSVYSENVVADVFKINGSNLEKLYNIESTYTKWQFNPTDPNMIISVKNTTLSVIQCDPYVLLRSFEFASDEAFMNIDYFNNEILTINANEFIIRSLNTGNVIKRIAKRTEQYYLYDDFILHNHHIIKNNVMLKTQ